MINTNVRYGAENAGACAGANDAYRPMGLMRGKDLRPGGEVAPCV